MRDQSGSVRAGFGAEAQESYRWRLELFIEEARTLARLRHPNIVRVVSVFESNGTAYMVMELERGQSLGTLIKANAITDEAALLGIIHPLLDGLEMHASTRLHPPRRKAGQRFAASEWFSSAARFWLSTYGN